MRATSYGYSDRLVACTEDLGVTGDVLVGVTFTTHQTDQLSLAVVEVRYGAVQARLQFPVRDGVLVPHRHEDELGRREDLWEDSCPLILGVSGVAEDEVPQCFLDSVDVVTGDTVDHWGPVGGNATGLVGRVDWVEPFEHRTTDEGLRVLLTNGLDLLHLEFMRLSSQRLDDCLTTQEECIEVFNRTDHFDVVLVVLLLEHVRGEPQLVLQLVIGDVTDLDDRRHPATHSNLHHGTDGPDRVLGVVLLQEGYTEAFAGRVELTRQACFVCPFAHAQQSLTQNAVDLLVHTFTFAGEGHQRVTWSSSGVQQLFTAPVGMGPIGQLTDRCDLVHRVVNQRGDLAKCLEFIHVYLRADCHLQYDNR
ncbi:hypothetical protein D3C84_270490 [compost metagenome]